MGKLQTFPATDIVQDGSYGSQTLDIPEGSELIRLVIERSNIPSANGKYVEFCLTEDVQASIGNPTTSGKKFYDKEYCGIATEGAFLENTRREYNFVDKIVQSDGLHMGYQNESGGASNISYDLTVRLP